MIQKTNGATTAPQAQSNLTNNQFLMWMGQQLNADAPLYNMIQTFTIHGELNVEAFRQAFQALIDRSDALRSRIIVTDGIPQQDVRTTLYAPLEMVDFSQHSGPEAAYSEWLDSRKTRILPLDRQLFDSVLIKMANGRFIWYLNQHHLITDGISFAVVYKNMIELYTLALSGNLSEAPMLPQYSDYVNHERDFRQTDEFQEAVDYWQEKLKTPALSAAEVAVSPTDFYGKTVQGNSPRTDRIPCELGPERSAALRAIAQEDGFASFSQDMSLFTVFSTLLLTTLHRINGQRTLRIGTPYHNRTTADFKNTIGLFIEIGPMQVEIENNETFVSLGEKVMGEAFAGLMNAQSGMSSAELNRSYDVLLNFVNASFTDFAGLPVTTDWIHTGYGDSNHNLRLQVTDFDATGNFVLYFDVNTAVFSQTERDWLISHYLRVVDALIADHTQPLGAFDLISSAERQQLLVDFNNTDADYPADQTVVQLFEAQVARTPHAIAAVRGSDTITYADLNARANQLAHYLREQGVSQETAVAICMERSIEVLIAIWGILKAGGTYIPIDPAYPSDRITYMLEDADPALTLTNNNSQLTINNSSPIVNLNSLELSEFSITNPKPFATPDSLVYMIYTSGSTGQPKGTMLCHQGLVNYISWAKNAYQNGKIFDFPLYSSLAFDLTVTSIFVPLLSGGKVVVYSESDHPRGLEILSVFKDDAVDIVKLTPAHLALVQETAVSAVPSAGVSTHRIQTLIVGGEDFKTDLARTIHATFDDKVDIYNEYGPTEAVVGCMIHRYDPARDTAVSVPIGKPAANARIYLLNEYGRLVPPGVVGEMVISSDGVARGYRNRPELTAEKFGDDPFRPGARIYRTGDIARWNEHGQMVFLGRRDHQVKIRGARIELGEIEAALLSHPGVETAVLDVIQYQRVEQEIQHCVRCGLPSNYPDADIDNDGVCSDCRTYDLYRDQVQEYFRTPADLRQIFADVQVEKAAQKYDCMVMLSGGKDSTYMLYQIVREYGMRPLVFTLDNGFISEEALDNARRICADLDIDLKIASTPHMNAIFADSLRRHSNVCEGCFKTIYILSMNLAKRMGINTIITGLARGQLFETRLADSFRARLFDPHTIDNWIMDARKAYHKINDAPNQLLDVKIFNNDQIFNEIQFVDFYRYTDIDLDDVYHYLNNETVWQHPSDTGRSTNCLINDAGIYIHKKERGYHNYALPYSWDVRLGHKNQEMALYELDDDINVEEVRRMLDEIGYDENEKTAHRSEKRLAAYFVANESLSTSDLRDYLSQKLPNYMIPSTFTQLDDIPLTTNGKVDRSALPDPDQGRPELDSTYAPATNEREQALVDIWTDIFRLPQIGIHDNFFDLGGDSIISIQIIARARQAELKFEPQQLFEYQTIAELAAIATEADEIQAEQGLVTGSLPLTPIQHWFFNQQFAEPNHWNQSLWLDLPADVDVEAFNTAVSYLPAQHDALRLRFRQTETGWQQWLDDDGTPGLSAAEVAVPSSIHNLSTLPFTKQENAMTAEAGKIAASLDFERGPLLQVALFYRGPAQPVRLFVTVHHLAIDGVSWRPLLEDLETAYTQIQNNQPVSLPPKSSSFKQWSEKLVEWVGTETLALNAAETAVSDTQHWQFNNTAHSIPFNPNGANSVSDTHTVSVKLNTDETRALLQDVPNAYNTNINDALLTAATLAIAPVSENAHTERSRSGRFSITLEGHGREEEVIGGVDVSRTVGWFTTQYPVHLDTPHNEPGAALKSIKEQLRQVPSKGLSYGALRYMASDSLLANQPEPAVLFNYLGQFERSLPPSELFRLVRPLQADISPRNQRTHTLDINAVVMADQLHIDWTFSPQRIAITDVQTLANSFISELRELIGHCLTVETSESTLSDFDLVDFDTDTFDQLADMLSSQL